MIAPKYSNLPQGFWGRVRYTDSCWLWVGAKNKGKGGGYGTFWLDYKSRKTHKLAFFDKNGQPWGLLILHKCDVRNCVNPDHLYAGTQKDNVRDMFERGRANKPCGERQHLSKLTEKSVLFIRSVGTTISSRKLGAMFGVDKSTILRVRRGQTWNSIRRLQQ